jgi:hypothetical protein
MYIYTFLLRMADTLTSQNIDLSSWDILYMYVCIGSCFENPSKGRVIVGAPTGSVWSLDWKCCDRKENDPLKGPEMHKQNIGN